MNSQTLESWSSVLEKIQSQIPGESFSTWFDNTSLEEITEDKVVIGVPNRFVKTFIESKFSEAVISSIRKVFNKDLQVQYKIVQNLRNKVEQALKDGVNLKGDTPPSLIEPKKTNYGQSSVKTDIIPHYHRPKNYYGLPLVNSYKLDNFVVGPSNRVAFSGIQSVLESPGQYNPVFLYSGSGLGKTHMLHGLCHELLTRNPNAKVIFISCEEFINDFISHIRGSKMDDFREKYRKVDVLLIDDIHFLGQGNKDQTQDEFFHTFDALYNTSCQIIVSSDAHPKDIVSLKDKIQMRFISGLVAAIEPPNFATRSKILKQKCKEKDYHFSKEVIELIASNITTNVRELEGALVKIHAMSRFENREVSLELAQQTLNIQKHSSVYTKNSPEAIIRSVAEFFNLSYESMMLPKRGKNAIPRQLSMLVMRKLYSFSYQDICDSFGCKSHASVVHGEKCALKAVEKEPSTKIVYQKLVDHLQAKP